MMKYVFSVLIVLSMIGAAALWLTNIVIKAERAAVMEKAIKLTRDTDKRLNIARKATDADICHALGGTTVEGKCQ